MQRIKIFSSSSSSSSRTMEQSADLKNWWWRTLRKLRHNAWKSVCHWTLTNAKLLMALSKIQALKLSEGTILTCLAHQSVLSPSTRHFTTGIWNSKKSRLNLLICLLIMLSSCLRILWAFVAWCPLYAPLHVQIAKWSGISTAQFRNLLKALPMSSLTKLLLNNLLCLSKWEDLALIA